MIDKGKLLQALNDACDKDVFKDIPKWILDVINNQPEVGECKKSYIEQVANVLGLELYQEFKIKPTNIAKLLGYKEMGVTFMFDDGGLMHEGYDDGWSKWYGNNSDILECLIIGLYEVEVQDEVY